MVLDGRTELLVLFLEKSNTLLKRFQKELLADTASLGVFSLVFFVGQRGDEPADEFE